MAVPRGYREGQREENYLMPDAPKFHTCHHNKSDGIRCGSPSLKGKRYCYYHYTCPKPHHTRPMPLLDEPQAVHNVLEEVLTGLCNNTLDSTRAHLMLLGLRLALQNLPNCPEEGSRKTRY